MLLLNIYNFAFVDKKLDFVYLSELFNLYHAHCDENKVADKFRKNKNSFAEAISELVGSSFVYGRFSSTRRCGSSHVTGWASSSLTKNCVDEKKPTWTTSIGGRYVMVSDVVVEDSNVKLYTPSDDELVMVEKEDISGGSQANIVIDMIRRTRK